MKYTNESIASIVESYDGFKEHLEVVMHAAGLSNDVESIDGVYNHHISVTTAYHGRCGYESESHNIPLEWLTTEDSDVLKEKIAAKRAQESIEREERRRLEQQRAAEQQRERDLAELNRLRNKYETTNGETP